MEIKVLWLDDEFDSVALKSTFIRMEKHFTLIKCNTKDEFFFKIEHEDWDAIVLDVLDANGRDSGFRAAVMRILSKHKDEPWFVFSGQTDVLKSESSIREMLQEEDCQRDYADIIYVKSEDNDKLIEDIKSSVNDKESWLVKNKYNQVLSVFDIIGKESHNIMLDVLMYIEGYKTLDHKVYYTQLRMILEWIFRHANQIGLLHDKCINNESKQVNLTESSRFLAGKDTEHLGVRLKESKGHFPKLIAENVRNLLFVTGGASHTTEPDEKEVINLQEYWKLVNTPYLLYSLTFNLCDILVWYNKYQGENNNYAENISRWEEFKSLATVENPTKESNIIVGKITNFNDVGVGYIKPNGSNNRKENCCIGSSFWLQKDDELTIEFEEKTMKNGNMLRVATKILEHKNKID